MNITVVKEYIDQHLSPHLGLKEIAAAFDIDPGELDRLFRNGNGTTIKKYIDARLKEQAAQLISFGKPGYEIGKTLGFRSDGAFYKWARRVFGDSLKRVLKKSDTRFFHKILTQEIAY